VIKISAIIGDIEKLTNYNGSVDLEKEVTDNKGFSAVRVTSMLPRFFQTNVHYKLKKQLSSNSRAFIKRVVSKLNEEIAPIKTETMELPNYRGYDRKESFNVYFNKEIPKEKVSCIKKSLKRIEDAMNER
jgi:hypothetical protein